MNPTNHATSLRGVLTSATLAITATLISCSTMPVASSSQERAARYSAPASAALGTGWGEARDSRVEATAFNRAHAKADGVGELHYHQSFTHDSWSSRSPRELAGGRVAVGLKGANGRWLPTTERGGRVVVKGEQGERYEIVVRNLTRHRIEAVVSVDGLDVLDGRSASYSKRGHLIGPRGTVTIPGWRTSTSSVAAFRFAAVGDSYAARKHGDTRNVGVIGVAVFTEKPPPMRVFAEPPPGGHEPNPFPGERWARPPRG